MKKKIIIISIIVVVLAAIITPIVLYFNGLKPLNNNKALKEFTIKENTSKLDIIANLKNEGLIKSKFSGYVYVLLNRNLNLQAATYELSSSMSLKEILTKINNGEKKQVKNTFNIRFIEGKRLTDYAKIIATNTNTTESEVLKVLSDQEYLNELIDKYWFLTDDILNKDIYYPLEGYLFASTYELYNGSGIKDIVSRMLDGTADILDKYKEEIEASNYSVHELLTMASVVELEGASSNDRAGVAGVFYNRLKIGEGLGSDVTTYYASQKGFDKDLTNKELNDCSNKYNTRNGCNSGKLPVGPICSPSLDAIKAAIEPSNHDYLFFVADKNKKTYFMKTNAEHQAKINELKANGLWYEYK